MAPKYLFEVNSVDMNGNWWSSLFLVSMAQGLFIVFLLFKRANKSTSAYLLIALLLLMIVTNFDFYSVSSGLFRQAPYLFGISFGVMFLFGPLLFFYAQSISDSQFRLKGIFLLHLVPYLINVLLNLIFWSAESSLKISFIENYIESGVRFRVLDKVLIGLQTIHLTVYLLMTIRMMRDNQLRFGNIPYITSITQRLKWTTSVINSFIAFALVVFFLLAYVLYTGLLRVEINNIYTLVLSGIIYFIAYRAILNPELITPNFLQKYRTIGALKNDEVETYVTKLEDLFKNRKLYTDADIRLADIARELGIHQNQLSRLVNEKYGKSFTDFINEYRIKEFMTKVMTDENRKFNIYGLATEVGFKSKSTFNTAFKKATGKTPSEFRRENQ